GQDRVRVLEARRRRRVHVREAEVVAHHLGAGRRVGDVNAVTRVVGEPVVDHTVAGLRERPDVDDDVEHLLARIVVLGADERVDVGQVGLRVLLDERRVAVARGARESVDEGQQQCREGHDGPAPGNASHGFVLLVVEGYVSCHARPPLATAWIAMDRPRSVITAEDMSGSQRVTSGPRSSSRVTRRPAQTTSRPIATSTRASPRLKATISSRPKPTRRSDRALSSTTRAAGHGTIPPVMPRAQSWRSVTPPGAWLWWWCPPSPCA